MLATVLVGLTAFLRFTRYGLIIRAGVENRAMVTALGIDVRKAFTLVFAIGGAAAGIVIWILAQAMINMGMVLGLLPVIGIPLPLISAGGSSLFATLVACGILLNCATTEPGARAALDASRARRRRRAAARKR